MDQSSSFSLLIEEPVVISKVGLHLSGEMPRPQTKTPSVPSPLKRYEYERSDGFAWRLSCVNFVNFRLAWRESDPSFNIGRTGFMQDKINGDPARW